MRGFIASLAAAAALGVMLDSVSAADAGGRFTIRAEWFDRGNVRASSVGSEYADKYSCIWNAGQLPNRAEYDLDFPASGKYRIDALYTAADARPVDIYIDGVKQHRGFASVTGSWQTASAKWETQCTVALAQGRHTIKLECPGSCMPHICALRFETGEAFPAAWRLARKVRRSSGAAVEPVSPPAHGLLAETLGGGAWKASLVSPDAIPQTEASARDELLQPDYLAVRADGVRTALVEVTRPDGSIATERLDVVPSRLFKSLDHAERLLADYETTAGNRVPVAPRQAEIKQIRAGADRAVAEPESDGKWQRLVSAYVAAVRLEAAIALANPLLDFERLLVVRRSAGSPALGLPQNWQSNCALPTSGFDNEIATLDLKRSGRSLRTVYRPREPVFVGDVDLHFDGGKMLFSSVGNNGRWHVFEAGVDGSALRQVTPSNPADVNNYDPCYLPDERILFSSTASMAAVPCVNGSTLVANLYRINADGDPRSIRQLCFDQEHNWCPTVLPNGRVLYLRWEYTDTPHSHDRVLFHMNPDGTGQMEYSGSNSYWPNAMFYARPIPGRPTQFCAIVGGHHGVPRMGELVVFDVAKGRREAEGVVGRIPRFTEKVEPIIADNLVDGSWPKFLHPYPLSDKYFLVAAQQTPGGLWGIYLVDTFDGMTLLKELPGHALLEPIPLRPTARPPVIPDKTDPNSKEGTVYLADIYAGGGLAGVPRGTVKQLRVISYHYLYPGMGGPQGVVGMEGPWDIKRILGTVPVDADGSAVFRVPANTPVAVQPLDAEGKALQLMRSWFTAMPGETVSCVGCHESQNSGPPNRRTLAAARRPSTIEPWRGPARGFNFAREVQPVLDRHCVGCHNGLPPKQPASGEVVADLRGGAMIGDYTSLFHHGGVDAGHFSTSYAYLHRFVRRPGLESDYHMLVPMEFHADATRLVQLLRKGHHGVALDAEAWDRLITWIDLNAPYHGTWTEIAGPARVAALAKRRRELMAAYGNVHDDPEWVPPAAPKPTTIIPKPEPSETPAPVCAGWPFDAAEAKRRQTALGQVRQSVDMGGGVSMELVRIPAGKFVMGDPQGDPDERPACVVDIARPFWIGRCEVTNRQFARFAPSHDSRVESKHAMQFGVRGFYVNGPQQPVVRIAWREAAAFCDWLGAKTGRRCALPTEAQWEYACRAGTAGPFSYGDLSTDFAPFANLADRTLREFVCDPYNKARAPFANPGKYDDWIPKDDRFADGGFVSEDVGRYRPNAWGLLDMHGNVAEWTRSAWRPYPYRDDDGRNDSSPGGFVARDAGAARVVRGGSWRDCPRQCRSASRLPYREYQPVYNVGFRVVMEELVPAVARATAN